MKSKEEQIKESQNADSSNKKDAIKERLMEIKKTYEQMIKLRKDNLDTFKKIDMSKYIKF